MLEATDITMMHMFGAARALLGVVRIAKCLSDVVNWLSLRAFITTLAWKVAARQYPTLVPVVLEVIFSRTFRGVPLGLRADGVHPFAEVRGRSGEERNRLIRKCHAKALAFQTVERSLVRFVAWAALERRKSQHRVMCWEDKPQADAAPVLQSTTVDVALPGVASTSGASVGLGVPGDIESLSGNSSEPVPSSSSSTSHSSEPEDLIDTQQLEVQSQVTSSSSTSHSSGRTSCSALGENHTTW